MQVRRAGASHLAAPSLEGDLMQRAVPAVRMLLLSCLAAFPILGVLGLKRGFVRDNGAGFAMRYATKLLTPFQRMHRRDEFEGSGIDLVIVQRVIARHGGSIEVEAAPGLGATFRFTLSTGR